MKWVDSLPLPNFMKTDTAKLLIAASMLVGALLVYGVLQERIMTIPYGPNQDAFFTFSAFLVLNNRIVVVFVALALLIIQGESIQNVAPLHKYFYISFSNTIASFCQYESLRYISFPTQTLGKCGKMIPVMIISGILGLKKYQAKDYVSALSISFGCALFLLGGDTAPQKGRQTDSIYGIMLMGGYLFFDGFTSTFQEKLFKDYTISSHNQMLYVNMTSAILSFVYLVLTQNLIPAVEFAILYPASYGAAFSLSLAACCGQLIIYYIIKNHGALAFATIMVFRNVVAIILSCIIFFHPLTTYQWMAGGLVLGTYYVHSITKKRGHKAPPQEDTPSSTPSQDPQMTPSQQKPI